MISLIIWGAGASVLGLLLGYLGYFHSKIAYSIFTTSVMIFVYCSDYILQLTGTEERASETAGSGGFSIVESVIPFRKAIENMGYLPMPVKIAILTFSITFFIARIATWARKTYGPKPAEESAAERKARILKSYGMKNMEELRSRY